MIVSLQDLPELLGPVLLASRSLLVILRRSHRRSRGSLPGMLSSFVVGFLERTCHLCRTLEPFSVCQWTFDILSLRILQQLCGYNRGLSGRVSHVT